MGKKNLRRNIGLFAGIPVVVITSCLYCSLPPLAKAILLELAAQYRGSNNGYLSLTRDDLKRRGFPSPNSNRKAIELLIEHGLIVRTAIGRAKHNGYSCSYYAIAWQPINERIDKPLEVTLSANSHMKFLNNIKIGAEVIPVIFRTKTK